MAGKVSHFEVHAKDGKKSQEFYAALFGWNVDANNPMKYGMVQGTDGGIGGGVTQAQDGKPMVTFYVEVADLAAALKKAESLGGKTVSPPMDIPGGPTIAMMSDPDGNTIGLMKEGSMS